MAKKKEAVDVKNLAGNKAEINLKEFMLLDSKAQDAKIKEVLEKEMYEETFKVEKKHVEKVLNIAFDSHNNEVYLPNNLLVKKEGSKLLFSFRKRSRGAVVLLFALALLGAVGFSSYAGIQYLAKLEMNVDLDGDGVADLNIDLDDDGICDINCDTDKDRKPDVNIDYHNNRKGVFNVLTEVNGQRYYSNPINLDIDNDGTCDINCDTNDDGWPDLNIDYDGDGVVDLDRDINGDGIKDLDLDLNGDFYCDLNCDDNKDDICDRFCTNAEIQNNGNGTSTSRGNGGLDFTMADLIVTFDSENIVNASMLFPDDQDNPEYNSQVPDLKFTVQNTTGKTLYYNIDWIGVYNDFLTTNFWYRVASNNDGFTTGWQTAPFEDGRMASLVAIAAGATQNYTVSFTLHGTGEEQNEDQGKSFKSQIRVELYEQVR